MGTNVYLTFFHGYDSHSLRRLEPIYLAVCYGLPLLPAFIYLLLDVTGRENIYGAANIWCWITPEYEWTRIAFFYGPVWYEFALCGSPPHPNQALTFTLGSPSS